jgi:hypothetical protein
VWSFNRLILAQSRQFRRNVDPRMATQTRGPSGQQIPPSSRRAITAPANVREERKASVIGSESPTTRITQPRGPTVSSLAVLPSATDQKYLSDRDTHIKAACCGLTLTLPGSDHAIAVSLLFWAGGARWVRGIWTAAGRPSIASPQDGRERSPGKYDRRNCRLGRL